MTKSKKKMRSRELEYFYENIPTPTELEIEEVFPIIDETIDSTSDSNYVQYLRIPVNGIYFVFDSVVSSVNYLFGY